MEINVSLNWTSQAGRPSQSEDFTDLTDLGCWPKSTAKTRGKLPATSWAETGLTPSQSVRIIELYILTRALTCSAFWSHPDVLCGYRTFLILREHTLPRFVYIRRVCLPTRLPFRVRLRFDNRKYTRLLNMTHMTLAVCTLISRLCVYICCIFWFDDTKKRTNALSCK